MALRAWLRLKQLGFKGISTMAHRAVARTQQLVRELQRVGVPAWCNPWGVCAVFPTAAVTPTVAARFGVVKEGEVSHVYVMDSVPDGLLQLFVQAMAQGQGKGQVGKGGGSSCRGSVIMDARTE
jgi:glutamate/tyrosine decarboxylase-like PLP-dependent enzyme